MPTDGDLLRKFKALLDVTQEIRKAEVAEYLGITTKELLEKLVLWRDLKFKIKGEWIVVDDPYIIISALDRQFLEWEKPETREMHKGGNFCVFCGNAKIEHTCFKCNQLSKTECFGNTYYLEGTPILVK